MDVMTKMDISRIEPLEALVAKEPGNSLAHYMLANEYLKVGRHERALQELEVYFGMVDDEGAGYRMAATANLVLGRREEAREAYRRGIEAAERHHHPGMASEFREALEDMA